MTARFHVKLMTIMAFGIMWLPLSAFGFVYHAESIEGWVTEAETNKPLEGVIVIAFWQLKGGIEGGTPIGQLQIYETVTDKNGRYYFPAWGPKFALFGRLKSESPGIYLFRSGYKILGLDNNWYPDRDLSKSDWNKKTVKLESFKGTLGQYADHLAGFNDGLWMVGFATSYRGGDPCGWKAFPQMLRALDRLETEFRSAGVVRGTVVSSLRANDAQLRAAGCGSVEEVVRR
jgi:hypothetical protein